MQWNDNSIDAELKLIKEQIVKKVFSEVSH